MKIQTKVSILISAIAIIFIIGISAFKVSEDTKLKNISKEIETEKIASFQRTIQSIGKSLEVFAYDYTYWDEMVDFVQSGDSEWAFINIQSSLSSFNTELAWVYKPDFTLLYSTNILEESLPQNLPFTKEEMKEIFKESNFCHFYLRLDNLLVEIRGAPIQPSADLKRETKSKGYFLIGRVLDEEFIENLSLQTGSKVIVEKIDGNSSKLRAVDENEFILYNSVDLPRWDKKSAAKLVFVSELMVIRKLNEYLSTQVLFSLGFAVLILIIVSTFLITNVNKPLKKISQSLKESNPLILNDLNKSVAEFKNLGSLVNQFFNQKNELVEEIERRKNIEASLQKSEEKYRTIFENVQDVHFQTNQFGDLISISPSVEKHSGHKPAEVVGKPVKEFFQDTSDSDKMFKYVKKAGELSDYETVLISKEGKKIFVSVNIHLRFYNRKFVGLDGSIRNITEQKLHQENIKKLSQAIEQSPVSVIITNPSGEIEYVNPKFTEVSGYSFEEVKGSNPRILKSGVTSSENYKELWESISAGNEWRGEFHNRKKNGELYWELAVISPIKNLKNEIINFIAIKEDITEKKRIISELETAKEKAEELSKLKSSFLANMSHELRTPLIGILGFSEILSSEIQNAEWQKMVDTIYNSGTRLLETLNQILDLSKFEAEKVDVKYTTIRMDDLIKESLNQLKPLALKKKLYLKTLFHKPGVIIKSDYNLLLSVLNNLIGNAIKYTHTGGITVELNLEKEKTQEMITIKVIDTGIGISSASQKIIFDEFRQVSEGFSRKFEGTGLGLSITKKIVDKFNGEISVESKEGSGSTFTVKFPANQNGETTGEEINTTLTESKDIPTKQNKKNILFIDDDEVSRSVVKAYLKRAYTVDFANEGSTALKQVDEKLYSIVLLDINLGRGLTGVEVLKKIRARVEYKNIPIIAVTAYAMVGERDRLIDEGFTDYISKPFTRNDLLELIAKYIPVE